MIQIKKILCAVDLTESSRPALRQALAMAAWYDADVTASYVIPYLPTLDAPPTPLDAAAREHVLLRLRQFAADPSPNPRLDFRLEESESVAGEIVRQAGEIAADLVVIGSHGRSTLQRVFLGSVGEGIMHRVHCPTLVVPSRLTSPPVDPARFRKILCAIDFSDSSLGALTYAFRLAEEQDAELTLLHVVELAPDLRELLLAASLDPDVVRRTAESTSRERLLQLVPDSARLYCRVKVDVAIGTAHEDIVSAAAANGSDVIVMGVTGRRSLGALALGSNTSRVARKAECPVLVVRS